ncbi:MAG: MarR family transcriptional regulator [Nevskia sp.]|nr:MarR family transcriptional regulator [Nevskia sp.]
MTQSKFLRRSVGRTAARDELARSADQRTADFARQVLKKFRIVFSSIRTHYRDVESECGLSGSQLWALAEIERQPDVSVSALASSLLVHQSTASNLLDGLEAMELVTKHRTREDQRVVRLRVTKKGQELLSRAPAPTIGVLLDALQNLPEETLWGLSLNMDALTTIMNRKDESAAAKPLADL